MEQLNKELQNEIALLSGWSTDLTITVACIAIVIILLTPISLFICYKKNFKQGSKAINGMTARCKVQMEDQNEAQNNVCVFQRSQGTSTDNSINIIENENYAPQIDSHSNPQSYTLRGSSMRTFTVEIGNFA